MQRIIDLLSSLKMTILGGTLLAVSLVLMLTKADGYFDPAWITVVVCGVPIIYYAVTALVIEKKISSALLISIAMIASIAIGELFAAGEVAFIMALGGILEGKTVERARKGLRKLISLVPETGRRLLGGREETVPVTEIREGDILRVLPGEAVPVDGGIVSGNTSVDQSIITGESLPVDKGPGDEVFCGTINRFGSVDIKATRVGEDSSLQKLIRLTQEAENNKAPMHRIADKWATWLVPIALLIAVVTYIATQDVIRAVTVLVVFCPCALVLATPTSIMAAIGQATKHGVIIKSGEALENMGRADTIAFDKTGTLTYGQLAVSDVLPFEDDMPETELLRLAASAEAHSEHPLGKAIVARAKEKNVSLHEAVNFSMIPGKGVSADVGEDHLVCGNAFYLAENGISFNEEAQTILNGLRSQGKAVIIIASRGGSAAPGKALGVIALSDRLRETAETIVSELGQTGTEAVLLTGDHAQTADWFAAQVGIGTVHSEQLPEQKVEKIQAMQQAGRKVCMIGDGVNDAPALKTASVGVAMGGMGSDIAIEAADIVLMEDSIDKVPYLKRLSNATVRLIRLNITISLVINFVAITLSVLGYLTPVTGALVHNAGSVLVTLNAALLYDRKYI